MADSSAIGCNFLLYETLGVRMRNFMSISKGLPKDEDRALYLDVKLSNKHEICQFEQDGGMANARFFGGFFIGQAYDESGHVCLGIRLESVTHWKYATV